MVVGWGSRAVCRVARRELRRVGRHSAASRRVRGGGRRRGYTLGQLRLPVALCVAVLCAPEPVVDVLVVVVPVVAEVDVAALAIAAPPPAMAPMVASVAIRV